MTKGQLIGHSGDVGANFAHVHFEIRSAPDFDPTSAWQRHYIHPLAVLPYGGQRRVERTPNQDDLIAWCVLHGSLPGSPRLRGIS